MEIDKTSEEWRHECEVRFVARMEGVRRIAFMQLVDAKRGPLEYQKLADGVRAEMARLKGQHEKACREQVDLF